MRHLSTGFIKKDNRYLGCSDTFVISYTAIVLSQSERPGLQFSIVIISVRLEESLNKYESSENSWSKFRISLHIFKGANEKRKFH